MDINAKEEKKKIFANESSENTFQYDDSLPNLAVPALKSTLAKYLQSVIPHVTVEEFENTKRLLGNFEDGIGKILHSKLVERAKNKRNWLSEWWEDIAYLSLRSPIYVLSNMAGSLYTNEAVFKNDPEVNFKNAIYFIHYYLQSWKLLRTETLRPQKSNGVPFSMNQWKRLFNCCRIPGQFKDHLVEYFKTESDGECGPSHVTVLHKGYIFIFDAVISSEILSPDELNVQIKYILDSCSKLPSGPALGALTCDNRTTWYENRQHLLTLHPTNATYLKLIESSMFAIVLDLEHPLNELQVVNESLKSNKSEHVMSFLGGDVRNRWADKSFSLILSKNGLLSINCDHSAFDAIVPGSVSYYAYLCVENEEIPLKKLRSLREPQRLDFHIDNFIEKGIENAVQVSTTNCNNLEARKAVFSDFGKEFMTSQNRHPDYLVQLAMQLAYYRMYSRPAPTYETATTRRFFNGRTETVRSCTPEAVNWSKAMLSPTSPVAAKQNLMDIAYSKHKQLMSEALMNEGCDRHLLGLYLIAQEEGIPVPEIYLDPSYSKSGGNGNFILSTSLLGYIPHFGATAAMCENGYGIFYSIQLNSVTFLVTSWKSCAETNSEKFLTNIFQSLRDIKQLLFNSANL